MYGGGVLTAGRWFSSADEAVITSSLATRLGNVKVGDTVTFGDRPFTVCGIIDSGRYSGNYYKPNFVVPSTFYLCIDGSETMDFCYLHRDSADDCQKDYNRLIKAGYTAFVSPATTTTFENMNLCRTFFGSIALVLGIMVLFIMYSLLAIFYRQRKSQICRYKLLGANGSMIAFVYCIIVAVMGLLSCVAGAGFSVLFDIFFMSLCTELFGFYFAPGFHIYIPLAVYGVMLVFIIILYFIFDAKIKNTHIAQEIKYE